MLSWPIGTATNNQRLGQGHVKAYPYAIISGKYCERPMVQLSVPYVLLITVPTLAVSIYKSNKIHLVLAHCVSVRLTAFSILQHLCAARSCYVDPFSESNYGSDSNHDRLSDGCQITRIRTIWPYDGEKKVLLRRPDFGTRVAKKCWWRICFCFPGMAELMKCLVCAVPRVSTHIYIIQKWEPCTRCYRSQRGFHMKLNSFPSLSPSAVDHREHRSVSGGSSNFSSTLQCRSVLFPFHLLMIAQTYFFEA